MAFFPFSQRQSFTSLKNPLCKFICLFSTSLLPSDLSNLFSEQSTATATATATAAAEEPNNSKNDIHLQNDKPDKSKKARTMAWLINTMPWSAQLESSLSTHTPLSETSVLQTLRLIKAPANALQFFNWTQNTGFTHSEHSYFLVLEIFGRARNLNSARNFLLSIPAMSNNAIPLTGKLFNSLIRSYGNAGLCKESIEVFKIMKSMGISPSTVTFNYLFLILLKRGWTGKVFKLYDEMLKTHGTKPNLYTFNILIRALCMNSRMNDAFRFFKEMELFNCKPDLISYNTIVEGLCRARKVQIAHNVVKSMHLKGENLKPNVITYNTLVRGYCWNQEIDTMLLVLREMVDCGIKPNDITYNTIIHGLCKAQMFDKIKYFLDRGEHGGFVPDTCTFNMLMNAHCNVGELSKAFKVFEKMKELKVQQDSTSYSVLIRGLCQKLDFGLAEELIDELLVKEILLCDDGSIPLVAAYNPILEYLCRNGKSKKAEQVLRQLMRRGKQNPVAYKTLILGHCKEGTCVAGHKLLVLMRRDFLPDLETYESLIEALLQKGEPNLAHDTLEMMLKSSYLPGSSTFQRILTELVKQGSALESASLVILMLKKQIRQNISLSTDTIKLLFTRGLLDRAFEVVRRIYENSYVLNMEELIEFLCHCKKLMEARELVVFSLKNDHKIDVAVYNTVLTNLCKSHRASEAFNLYCKMLEKGIQQPLSCIEDLRSSLEAQGKLKEAEFVTKRMPGPLQLDGSGSNLRSK